MNPEDVDLMERGFERAGQFIASWFLGNIGQHHVVRVNEPFARIDADHRAVMARGSWRVVECPVGSTPFPDMTVGMISTDRPDYTHAGRYIFECLEDGTLYICLKRYGVEKSMGIGYKVNEMTAFQIPQGGAFILGAGNANAVGVSGGNTLSGLSVVHAKNGPVIITPLTPCTGILGVLP